MLPLLAFLLGTFLVLLVLLDAFATILLPRTLTGTYRLTRLFYRATWQPWAAGGERFPPGPARENFLSFFGPLSIVLLTGFWAAGLIAGFGLLQWACAPGPRGWGSLGAGLYTSGNLFFTLGFGDAGPRTGVARALAVLEAGLGFGFLASIISYLPVIYAGFSRREAMILRVGIRAGTPPSAGELLRQHGHRGDARDLDNALRDAERWAADLLESHLSYPVLCLYRSQHRDQSWLATLTTILDACALLVIGVKNVESRQAPMTFAMARRALLDMAHVFHVLPGEGLAPAASPDRLPAPELARLRGLLAPDARLAPGPEADEKLTRLRATYEPAAHALSGYLLMPLPPWMPPPEVGNRPTSAAEILFEEDGAPEAGMTNDK